MDIQYYGANCIRLKTKNKDIVIDDNLATLGQKSISKTDDISLVTNQKVTGQIKVNEQYLDMPGEYEIGGFIVRGIPAYSNIGDKSVKDSVIYVVTYNDISVLITGHIDPNLTDEQLEKIGIVDIAIVPCGGYGYTMDSISAVKLTKNIEPKVVIPVHYADKELNYSVVQDELTTFIKEFGSEPINAGTTFKTKNFDYSDKTQLVVLDRQSK